MSFTSWSQYAYVYWFRLVRCKDVRTRKQLFFSYNGSMYLIKQRSSCTQSSFNQPFFFAFLLFFIVVFILSSIFSATLKTLPLLLLLILSRLQPFPTYRMSSKFSNAGSVEWILWYGDHDSKLLWAFRQTQT